MFNLWHLAFGFDRGRCSGHNLALFIRYYFPETATKTSPWFGEAAAGINGSHQKNSQEDLPVSLMLGLRAGYAHFITRKWLLRVLWAIFLLKLIFPLLAVTRVWVWLSVFKFIYPEDPDEILCIFYLIIAWYITELFVKKHMGRQ